MSSLHHVQYLEKYHPWSSVDALDKQILLQETGNGESGHSMMDQEPRAARIPGVFGTNAYTGR